MTLKFALATALVLGFAGAAVAADGSQFIIIKDKSKHCRIIEQKMVSEDRARHAGRQAGLSEHAMKPISTSRSLCDNS